MEVFKMVSSYPDRDIRQRGIVPPGRLASVRAVVIGIGAVGRQTALQLAAIGAPHLTLIDHDVVAVENLAPQGYLREDLGRHKVDATGELCSRINPDIQVVKIAGRFCRSVSNSLLSTKDLAIFACVDRIDTRRMIWNCICPFAAFFADGRMNSEAIRAFAVDQPSSNRSYESSLFAAGEAFVGPCSARSTIFTASVAGGLLLHQFARWLRGIPVEPDQTLSLLASELFST
jgi:molybdopterin-synthase adenylyltransferase